MGVIVVTGSNRGIGLELCRQLAARGERVVAICRLSSNELASLGVRVVAALLPRMEEGGKIAMITSRMGSIADNAAGSWYGLRMSKAALNAAAVSLA